MIVLLSMLLSRPRIIQSALPACKNQTTFTFTVYKAGALVNDQLEKRYRHSRWTADIQKPRSKNKFKNGGNLRGSFPCGNHCSDKPLFGPFNSGARHHSPDACLSRSLDFPFRKPAYLAGGMFSLPGALATSCRSVVTKVHILACGSGSACSLVRIEDRLGKRIAYFVLKTFGPVILPSV
jgi:hypothetical protein